MIEVLAVIVILLAKALPVAACLYWGRKIVREIQKPLN